MKYKILSSISLVFLFCLNAFGQTTTAGTIQHDGLTREYVAYVPAVYDGSVPVPLVFNFHGYSSNNLQQIFYGEFRPIADTANFILVLPQGSKNNANQTFWNTFGGPETVDDVGFVSNLIDSLNIQYNIDQNRIYSTGMSNGGFMSYKLACELNDRIAAIASVTGSMIVPEIMACNPPRPIPVMEIHGTADDVVPYPGGDGFTHIDTLVNFWVQHNNCTPDPTFTAVPDIDQSDNCTAEHYFFGGGALGSTVELYKIIDGGHSWPGAVININVTNQDFDASEEIWRFFRQYELSSLLTSVESPLPESLTFSVYPNPSAEHFNIEFQNSEERIVIISNHLGQEIQRFRSQALKEEILLQNPGIYFITIENRGIRQTRKIVRF